MSELNTGTMGKEEESSQSSFKGSDYEDASWEVIGTFTETLTFSPMEIQVLGATAEPADAMFQDFGGRPKDPTKQRWHTRSMEPEDAAETTKNKGDVPVDPLKLEAAKQEGFQEGIFAGKEEAAKEYNEKLEELGNRFSDVLSDLQSQFKEEIVQIEKKAVDLSLSIARRIIEAAVEINPEYVIPIINEAISLTGSAKIQKVRVSTQDLEFIDVVGVRKKIKDFDSSWDFEGDETIKSGCVVETTAGEIDFQLDQAWERVRDNVVKVIR